MKNNKIIADQLREIASKIEHGEISVEWTRARQERFMFYSPGSSPKMMSSNGVILEYALNTGPSSPVNPRNEDFLK